MAQTTTNRTTATKASEQIRSLRYDITHRLRLSPDEPGNTIVSMEETLQAMADQLPSEATILIEFDIQATQDGVVVVHHDPSFTNVNGDQVTIEKVRYADLQEDANLIKEVQQKVPSLEDFLNAADEKAKELDLQLLFNIDTKNDAVVDPFITFLEKDFRNKLAEKLGKGNQSQEEQDFLHTYIGNEAAAYFEQEVPKGSPLNLETILESLLENADLGYLDRTNFASFDGRRTRKIKEHFEKWNIALSSSPGEKEVITFLRKAIMSTEKSRLRFAASNDFTCIQIPGTLRHALPSAVKNAPIIRTLKKIVPNKLKDIIVAPKWLTDRFQQMGFGVHVWTINRPETEHMARLMENGCLVITDKIETAIETRKKITPDKATHYQNNSLSPIPSRTTAAPAPQSGTSTYGYGRLAWAAVLAPVAVIVEHLAPIATAARELRKDPTGTTVAAAYSLGDTVVAGAKRAQDTFSLRGTANIGKPDGPSSEPGPQR